MWYRCNLKEHGASLYSSREETARAGQQAALRQPLLVKQNSCIRVPEVQHSTEACVQGPSVITRPKKALVHPCAITGSDAKCSTGLLPTSEERISTSAQVSGSGAALPSLRASALTPDSMISSARCAPNPATFVAASESAAGPALAAEIKHGSAAPPSISGGTAAATSTATATLGQPALAELGLQHSSSGGHSSTEGAVCPFPDPLLHWTECWAGPGLNRRGSISPNPHQQQHQDQSQRQQSRDSSGQGLAAPLSGAPHSPRSPRSPRSPARPYGVWWAGPEQHHTLNADSTPDRPAAATASAAAGTAPAAAVNAAPTSKHDANTRDWISSSCSSIGSNPPTAQPNNMMQLQMQQLPQLVQALRVQMQPCQQQEQQLEHAQQPQEQLPFVSSQPSSALPVSTGAQQPRHMFRWWLVGGVALAALSGSAVVMAYGVMTYMMKAAMVYSFAWKAATGVAAAEGLALGGWGCSRVRKENAAAKQSAADLARIRSHAARELAALKSHLQQREMAHGDEVATLTAANERLTRLAQSLRAENGNLQSALDYAAAERKSLEAAAALECSRAETSAVVSLAANHSERVVGEVSELRAMLLDLKEDLLGLVPDHAAAGSGQLIAEQSSELAAAAAAAVQPDMQLLGLCTGGHNGELLLPGLAIGQAVSSSDEQREAAVSVDTLPSARPAPLRLKSVRCNVDAALAASIAETLQL